jgi:hypothetical protein
VIEAKRNAPGLTQRQLADQVEGKFGEVARIDKSTVGRILRREGDQISHSAGGNRPTVRSETEPELGRHRRELYYFGQRFRDRIFLPTPHQVLTKWLTTTDGAEKTFWNGRPAIPVRDHAKMSEEEWNVEQGWGSGPFEARTHPLFPSFRDHLAEERMWRDFERLESQAKDYLRRCVAAYECAVMMVKANLPGLPVVDVESIAMSVVAGAHRNASPEASNMDFSYAIENEQAGDEVWWTLRLGAWTIRSDQRDDLHSLIDIHKSLLAQATEWEELSAVRQHEAVCLDIINTVRGALTPDSKLLRLIRSGSCGCSGSTTSLSGEE